jgi:hypothetical protein
MSLLSCLIVILHRAAMTGNQEHAKLLVSMTKFFNKIHVPTWSIVVITFLSYSFPKLNFLLSLGSSHAK